LLAAFFFGLGLWRRAFIPGTPPQYIAQAKKYEPGHHGQENDIEKVTLAHEFFLSCRVVDPVGIPIQTDRRLHNRYQW
jgi:hypothetical protein